MSNSELCDLVRRGEETRDLDYKGPMAWDEGDKKGCCSLVKDVLAMANTVGGHIVIGVAESGGILSWDGLSAEQLKTWDTSRVNRFLQNYADPPVNLRLSKVQCDDKKYVILIVPEFTKTP